MVLAGTSFALAETSATPASSTVAQAPAAKATPNPFSYKGYIRAYDFTRQNALGGLNSAGAPLYPGPNQSSFDAALSLHGQYNFDGGFYSGASYLYSNPLSGCSSASSRFPATPANGCSSKQTPPALNPDDTLPGFTLNTLYEAYLGFMNPDANLKVGYQVFNSPWVNPSDSRLKPVAFLGGDLTYKFNPNWNGEVAYMGRWENRTSSQFLQSTQLTAYAPVDGSGCQGLVAQTAATCNAGTLITNSGFLYAKLGYAGPKTMPLTANLYYYGFSNIANAFWLDAKMPFAGKLKPYVAIQGGSETNTGNSLVGIISSQVYGIQGGVSFTPNILATLGFDTMPSKSANVTLAAGTSCSLSHTLPNNKGAADYFLGTSAPQCVPGPIVGGLNTATVYYGGWASPYTDSYATDPLFTTSISQGMADRREFGSSGKLAVTFLSDDKRFTATVSRALYAYGNATVGVYPVQETNFDTTYYFSPLPKTGAYKGFFFRYRYAERGQTFTYAGATPLFKYNRFQAEYDF